MLKVIAMATRFQDFRNKKMKYVLKKILIDISW